ncbi:PKD domain-containing protein [Streptomyces sp. NPDC088762]|uniref:PKD domain-containing protein n=1 Tax=Streptomyces sp. NPDC088762 TaxID=3365891 RepID=UPI003804935E
MRPTRATVLLTAGLVTLLGVPGASAAETPASLYVSNLPDAHCSDAGSGTQIAPFCTISAAAKVVRPGQTVRIKPGKTYDEAVTIDRSGEPGRPIAFVAEPGTGLGESLVQLNYGRLLTVNGASHVVLRGLFAQGGVQISRSVDVELDRSRVMRGRLDSVLVTDGSADVRITRSRLTGARIEGGSQRTVLGRNMIGGGARPAVAAVDAPGTVITNNSLYGGCGGSLSLGGGSTGSALFNNLLHSEYNGTCADGSNGIAVSASAVSGTRADYNLTTDLPTHPVTPYRWSGTAYKDPAAFAAATGQGAHDILTPSAENVGTMDGSPTIDSGDPTAPGVLPSDLEGDPTADDPRVPNTGRDGGYVDRGAQESQDGLSQVWMNLDQTHAPVGTTVQVQAVSDSRWPTAMSYRVDFGDGTAPVVTRQGNAAHGLAEHVYTSPCDCVVKVTAVNGAGQEVSTEQPAKVTAAGPLTADFTSKPVLPTADDPIGHIAPLTVHIGALDATAAPWPVESMEVDFGDGTSDARDHLLNLQHTYSTPGEYQVKLSLRDSKGARSSVTKTVRADYAPSGYVATEPFRLLDSRTTGRPLRSGAANPVALPVGNWLPGHAFSGGMAAAVLNVTVTGATEDTHLTVWPSGQPRPTTSNVNVRAGGTSSNTVTVPVGADRQMAVQLNAGQAELIVDFVGYYQPGIGQRFSPITPTRLADTRAAGGAVAGGQTRTVKVAGVGGIPADATAVALNLTSTGTTANTHVIAYPDPAKRPTTSNLNPEPGKDKSNQAIVPVGPNGTVTLYNNAGSIHLVLDAVGYYGKDGKALFTPAVPKRLADTRTTGKLAPGATTTVAGLPAGALGAVLNVTATETTAPGFLTVYGTTRTDASSLNTLPGLTVPNHVTTPVASGRVNVFNSWGGSNHVITDLLGYFTQG